MVSKWNMLRKCCFRKSVLKDFFFRFSTRKPYILKVTIAQGRTKRTSSSSSSKQVIRQCILLHGKELASFALFDIVWFERWSGLRWDCGDTVLVVEPIWISIYIFITRNIKKTPSLDIHVAMKVAILIIALPQWICFGANVQINEFKLLLLFCICTVAPRHLLRKLLAEKSL